MMRGDLCTILVVFTTWSPSGSPTSATVPAERTISSDWAKVSLPPAASTTRSAMAPSPK